ncbi:MAG: hypothetical protein U1E89_12975 [Burkholderiaceae bacterium]
MSKRRHARRRVAGRRHHHLAVAAYALGLWLAACAWVALTQHLLPGARRLLDADATGLAIALWSSVPAVLGAFGYAIGLSWSTPAGPLPWPAQLRRAFLGGLAFTLGLAALVPLLALAQAGLWPAAVACVAGSAVLAAVQAARADARPEFGRSSRAVAP